MGGQQRGFESASHRWLGVPGITYRHLTLGSDRMYDLMMLDNFQFLKHELFDRMVEGVLRNVWGVLRIRKLAEVFCV